MTPTQLTIHEQIRLLRPDALGRLHRSLMIKYYQAPAVDSDEIGYQLGIVRETLIARGRWREAGVCRHPRMVA